ncbi:MAG: LysR family transcriptional regulator [Burkholderiales bacterium]|nr:LysR family transcriptional regulator [Burkholderiales bacterium]
MINVSTRVLRALIALDELRHFSLAAERCNVTQSAFSQMIAKLESDVGLRLVDRDRRRVSLTRDGERLVASARRMIAELDEIGADLRDHASMGKGRVAVATSPPFAAHWLPPLIAQFRTRHPGVRFELFDHLPPRCLELVRERQADFAIVSAPGPLAGLQYRVLFQESFVLACPKGHRLATRKRVDLGDLEGVHLVRYARAGSFGQHLAYHMRGIAVDDAMEVEHLPTVAGLVAAGLGVSVVPSIAVPFFDRDKVALVPLASPDLERPIHLVWQTSRLLGTAPQAFVDLLEKSLPRRRKTATAT